MIYRFVRRLSLAGTRLGRVHVTLRPATPDPAITRKLITAPGGRPAATDRFALSYPGQA
jgi:hypothetical protein